jgi:endonuclease YncB( thermonuclease family)
MPVAATVVKVKDGDTVLADVRHWLDTTLRVSVRVAGIDTPESTWRAKCDAERVAGLAAKRFVVELLPPGEAVVLTNVRYGKYAGRVLADIKYADRDLATTLIERGFARRYDGGKKGTWCGE